MGSIFQCLDVFGVIGISVHLDIVPCGDAFHCRGSLDGEGSGDGQFDVDGLVFLYCAFGYCCCNAIGELGGDSGICCA